MPNLTTFRNLSVAAFFGLGLVIASYLTIIAAMLFLVGWSITFFILTE